MQTIVRHIKTNDLYEHIEGNDFENVRTGVRGTVTDAAAEKCFKINVDAMCILNKFPIVKLLIKRLDLKIIPNEEVK